MWGFVVCQIELILIDICTSSYLRVIGPASIGLSLNSLDYTNIAIYKYIYIDRDL